MHKIPYKIFAFLCLYTILLPGACLDAKDIPDSLKPWIPWVEHGHEKELCTLVSGKLRLCQWAGSISMEFTDRGGTFRQRWSIEAPGWIQLPGSQAHWPVDVKADGIAITVVKREGRPAVYVDVPGDMTISGRFKWNELPTHIELPDGTAAIASLIINNRDIKYPDISGTRLWLRQHATEKTTAQKNAISIKVFRRIKDSVPMFIETLIRLQVSGRAREIVLGWKPPADQIPFSLNAAIPVRLNSDRQVVVKAAPGRWDITYVTRIDHPVYKLELGRPGSPWPDHEYWIFQAQPALRVVSVSGVPAVDPSLTDIPARWRSLPAYLVNPGQSMIFKEKRRGNSRPRPDQLQIKRTFWLDQDGKGFSIQDRITGKVSRSWRIESTPPMVPGRITISGRDQLITRINSKSPPGVELRQGRLDMTAESRIRAGGPVPVTGWKMNMKQVKCILNLPPGWRILHAEGVDSANTWITQWTLFDVFITLIFFLGVGRVHGWGKAFIALAAMLILYHEPDTPVMIWLVLLATFALMNTGQERFRKIVTRAHYAAALAALLMLVPFSVQQVRKAIYPQLELGSYYQMSPDWQNHVSDRTDRNLQNTMEKSRKFAGRAMKGLGSSMPYKQVPDIRGKAVPPEPLLRPDLQGKVQTGPGLPSWHWKTSRLAWNGPVKASQQMTLWFISPGINTALTLAGLAMLYLTAFFLIMPGLRRKTGRYLKTGGMAAMLVPWLFMLPIAPHSARAADFPSEHLLKELQKRVLQLPECAPDCASIDSIDMSVKPGHNLHLTIRAGAITETGIPLPRSEDLHLHSISIDNGAIPALLFRQGQDIFIRLPQGRHQISISSSFRENTIRLFFPLQPGFARFNTPGWQITGIDKNGVPAKQIQLNQIMQENKPNSKKKEETTAMPPFVEIKRILELGVEWHVTTTVKRLSPGGMPIIIDIPLIQGEAVTTDGVEVRNGRVRCSMGPGIDRFTWSSMLNIQDRITLTAPETDKWIEIWELDAGYMWHIKLSGIPPVYQETSGRWLPRWRPWPGEKINIAILRPEPVHGPTKTIDSSRLKVKPGLRITEASLDIIVRSSKGDTLIVRLPQKAELQSVSRDGNGLSIKLHSGKLALPLHPGRQAFRITWRQDRGITGWFTVPAVNLGLDSVNNTIEIVPGHRWLLFLSGPGIGPAILFYSEFIVFLVFACLIGMANITRIRTWQWILLAVGLSQSGLIAAGIVVGWLIALGLRERYGCNLTPGRFNLVQVSLAAATLAAFIALLYAIQNGLLGYPDMKIAGNGSNNHLLRWYTDRAGPALPRPGAFSLPVLGYRAIMLAWALWLSWSLLDWLRWGWSAFSKGGLWKPVNVTLWRGRKTRDNE